MKNPLSSDLSFPGHAEAKAEVPVFVFTKPGLNPRIPPVAVNQPSGVSRDFPSLLYQGIEPVAVYDLRGGSHEVDLHLRLRFATAPNLLIVSPACRRPMKNRQERPSGSCIPTKTSTPSEKLVCDAADALAIPCRSQPSPTSIERALTMDSRMREKEKIDDILWRTEPATRTNLKKGIRVNVLRACVECSIIRLAEAGQVAAMSPLVLIQKGNFMGYVETVFNHVIPKLVRARVQIRAELRRRARRGAKAGRF